MHPSPLTGSWNVIKSSYVEAIGVGLAASFSKQWLCLTADELLFFKDSTCSLLRPDAIVECNIIAYVEQDPAHPHQLRVCTMFGDIGLRFKSSDDMKVWRTELETVLKPVICIGENDHHHLERNPSPEQRYGLMDHPYRAHSDSPTYESEMYDEVASLRGFEDAKYRRSSFGSIPSSDATTLVAGSSRSVSQHSRHYSLASTSTRVSDSPYWNSPWVSDTLTKSWPDLSDILTAVEDEFAGSNEDDDAKRPPSPLDPDLVFDAGRVYFSVSEAPAPRDAEYVDLTGQITKIGKFPVATGGYADIWRGEWEAGEGPIIVAIKVIRSFSNNSKTDEKIKKRLAQELDIWTKLRHRNIIPLFGVVHDLGRHASMVSPWMDRGNAARFFEAMGAQATLQMRLKALCEVACGMEYLHCFYPPVIHGDLKASNVLINENGEAVLADFGISAVIEEATGSCRFTSSSFAGSVRWMAFELIRVVEDTMPHLTTHSDIWSYGSTVLEILTDKVPYHHRKNDIQVLHEIMLGIKPRQPDHFPDDIWNFLQTCWRDDPPSRPSVSVVRQSMDKFYRKSKRHAVGLNLVLNV